MRKLPKPVDDAGDIFVICISRIRNNVKNNNLKDRLDLVKLNISTCTELFTHLAKAD